MYHYSVHEVRLATEPEQAILDLIHSINESKEELLIFYYPGDTEIKPTEKKNKITLVPVSQCRYR